MSEKDKALVRELCEAVTHMSEDGKRYLEGFADGAKFARKEAEHGEGD